MSSFIWSFAMRTRKGALRSALSAKLRDGELKIVSAFQLNDHKTKNFAQALKRLEASSKVLVVDSAENRNLELGARNIEGVEVVRSHEVHPYHLLGARRVEPVALDGAVDDLLG